MMKKRDREAEKWTERSRDGDTLILREKNMEERREGEKEKRRDGGSKREKEIWKNGEKKRKIVEEMTRLR
jgi:hypothetical protein